MSTPSSTTQHAVDLINTHFDVNVLQGMQRGIERESLRMQANGYLSQQAHPMALGAALTHPSIIHPSPLIIPKHYLNSLHHRHNALQIH